MAKNVVTLNFNNTDYSLRPYATCSTAASNTAKVVSITGFTLCEGATILVKFSNPNTVINPTLNVNGTGAKPIVMEGQRNPILLKDIYYEFLYDGSNWQLLTNTSILHKHYSILNIGEANVTAGDKNWYTVGHAVDTNPCIYQISSYAHSDVVFSVTRASADAGLTILNNSAAYGNANYAHVNGVRLIKDSSSNILVQVRINYPKTNNNTYVSLDITAIPTMMTGNIILNDELIIDTTEYKSNSIIKSFDLNYVGSMYASNFIGDVTGKTFESLLQWGNKNIAGRLSPLDVAMDGQWSSNRLSFMPASGINIEYSTDGGTTWTDYGASDAEKRSFVTTGLSYPLSPGKKITKQKINSDRIRVTITAELEKTYFSLKKIYMFINQNGANECKVIIEKSQCGSDTTFTQVGEYSISGWSGWNSIPLDAPFGGRDDQTINIRRLRFTYYFTAYTNGYGETDDKLGVQWTIQKLNMIGETFWKNSGGDLPATGHIYSYDIDKNVIFPANLTVKGNTILGDATSDTITAKTSILPSGTIDLGSASAKWNNVYINNINGTAISSYALKTDIPTIPAAYELPTADNDTLGGIKTNYTIDETNKNYPVKVDNSGNAYVNVPWTGGSSAGASSHITVQAVTGTSYSNTIPANTILDFTSTNVSGTIDITGFGSATETDKLTTYGLTFKTSGNAKLKWPSSTTIYWVNGEYPGAVNPGSALPSAVYEIIITYAPGSKRYTATYAKYK